MSDLAARSMLSNATVTGLDVVKCVGVDQDLGKASCIDASAVVTSTADKGKTVTFSTMGAQGVPTMHRGDRVVLVAVDAGQNRVYSELGRRGREEWLEFLPAWWP